MAKIAVAIWILLVAAFLAITAYYIVFHHVVPLSRDQWHMYHALFEQGVWQTSITTVSGHRHILAFLLYSMDMHLFEGNNHFLVAVDWLLNLSLIALLCTQIRRCIADPLSRTLLTGWIILLLCWLLNIALLGWGFNGINNYLSIVSIVLSVFFLHRAVHQPRHTMRNTVIAVLLGGLATLSFGNGVLVWPVALLGLYLWRAPWFFSRVVLLAGAVFFLLYLSLPGGGAVGDTLRFNGWNTVLFPLQLMGAPLYHLLRAWQCFPEAILTSVATGIGVLVCVLACFVLWQRLQRRAAVDMLDALSLTVLFIGAGSAVLLTLTRVEGVLDPAVDRFQIWALLVWSGLSLLLYRTVTPAGQRSWRVLFFLFPLLALPSQLDWGARLAEYRTRVDNALLSYQVYLPVAGDAEKALHWNWQNKLPHLFPVLETLRSQHRNIFAGTVADALGKPLSATVDVTATPLPSCEWSLVRTETIVAGDLLDVSAIAGAAPYAVTATAGQPLGQRWYANVTGQGWDAGLVIDGSDMVRGLVQPVRNSRLPRFSGVRHHGYNAYGVARLAQAVPASRILLLEHGQPRCLVQL